MERSDRLLVWVVVVFLAAACGGQEPPPPPRPAPGPERPAPAVVVRQKPPTLTPEQRSGLRIPEAIIADLEAETGSNAEPFYEIIESRSANLRGEKEIERKRLAGFSVRTSRADEIVETRGRKLRQKGYLLFLSQKNYGSVPDVLTLIRGGSSYDILRVQKTEAPGYKLTNAAIIAWLRERQQDAPFTVIGAGQDWVEARFQKQPVNLRAFAKKVVAFAPDVLRDGALTTDKLAERMKRTNGFRLAWD